VLKHLREVVNYLFEVLNYLREVLKHLFEVLNYLCEVLNYLFEVLNDLAEVVNDLFEAPNTVPRLVLSAAGPLNRSSTTRSAPSPRTARAAARGASPPRG
jgi:hypothetical protein